MIVVVCLNPALDVTHHVTTVNWAGVNRPTAVHTRPGGKGVNVARTLHALDADLLLMGLAGGVTGAGIEAGLGRLGVPTALTPIAAETRRTFTVVDGEGAVTAFNEAGPEVSEREFTEFRGQYDKALASASAVVLSGSLPRGLAAGTYARLIETATAAGLPTVLDTHGEALLRGAAAGPAIVKPNLEELANLTGRRLSTADGPDLAAGLGLGSVMFDASSLPYQENVRATADVAQWCQARGIWVEAELGEIGGKNGVHSPTARTDPGEAAAYVAATGVDALAVAIGSSHAMLTRDAVLDLALIASIRRAVSVPLVLHGSSGVPDRDLAAAVGAGMTKINIATQLNKVFTSAVSNYLSAEPAVVDPRRYGGAGRAAVASEVARLLDLLGAQSIVQEETVGPRKLAVGTDVTAGGPGEPLSPVE